MKRAGFGELRMQEIIDSTREIIRKYFIFNLKQSPATLISAPSIYFTLSSDPLYRSRFQESDAFIGIEVFDILSRASVAADTTSELRSF